MKSIYSNSSNGFRKLSELTDVNIANPQNGEVLTYENSKWVNSAAESAVQSVFGRQGNVIAQNNDYSISQIQNSSFLANSANVGILPIIAQGETIRYNGVQFVNNKLALNDLSNVTATNTNNSFLFNNGLAWINQKIPGAFKKEVLSANETLTAELDTVYYLENSTLNVFSFPPFQSVNQSILVFSAAGSNNTIIGSGLSFFWDNQFYPNVTLSCFSYGVLQLVHSYTGGMFIIPLCGRWYSSTNNKYLAMNYLQDLNNVSISTPNNGDFLAFNAGSWVNRRRTDSFTFNSDGNLANNQFIYVNGYSQSATEFRTQMLLPYNIILTEINVFLTAAPSLNNSRTFNIRLNGVNQASITLTNFQTTGTQSLNISCSAGQFLSLQNTSITANNAIGIINIKYYYV